MSLPPEVRSALAAGHGILVPDPARAAIIRLAYADQQLKAGRAVWSTPDIATPAAMLARMAAEARQPLMSRATEWMLLREFALAQDAGSGGGASANGLADAWQRSLQLLRDQDIAPAALAAFATPETADLLAAITHLRERARTWGIAAPALVRPGDFAAPTHCVALGFAVLPRAYRNWVEWPNNAAPRSVAASNAVELHVAPTPADEVAAALSWARHKLDQNATARLLVVVPQGRAYEPALQRALAASVRLDAGRDEAIFLDRQRRLVDAPPVRQQLFLLRLLAGALPVAECCAGLRDGGAGLAEQVARAQLAHLLATQATGEVSLARIAALLRTADGTALEAAQHWLAQLQPAHDALLANKQQGGDWPDRLAAASRLLPLAWSTGNPEQDFRLQQAWQELLIECNQLVALGNPDSLQRALALLTARAARSPWPERRSDSRLHIARSTQDPVLQYDGIWVCGLAAAQWPLAPQPDPWVPKPLQTESGLAAASAAGRLQQARSELIAWRCASGDLHLSYPALLDEHGASVSPLLLELGLRETAAAAAAPARLSRAAQVQAAAPVLMQFADDSYSRLIQGEIRSGAPALNLFNECAFRGAAQLRLALVRKDDAVPGFEALQSGSLLHLALQRVWDQLGGSAGLAKIPETETADFVANIVAGLVREQLTQGENSAAARRAALAVEERRLTERISALLNAERIRESFVIENLEATLPLTLEGVNFRVRLDRVDRIGDQTLVIDYKTGKSGKPRWWDDPPRELQLLIYREALLAAGTSVAGLLTWHLLSSKLTAGGAAATELALFPPLAPRQQAVNWSAAEPGWSWRVHELAARLWQGDARLNPLKGACQYCDLRGLCRRDERLGPAGVDDDGGADMDNNGADGGDAG